jgi:hypothetical protein
MAASSGTGAGVLLRFVVPCVLPWAAFETVLLLVPLWAPDESHSLGGVVGTAVGYLMFIAPVGCLPGLFTARRALLLTWAVLLSALAATMAVLMVSSDDAQAGLAVLGVWFYGVPIVGVIALVEWAWRTRAAKSSAPA